MINKAGELEDQDAAIEALLKAEELVAEEPENRKRKRRNPNVYTKTTPADRRLFRGTRIFGIQLASPCMQDYTPCCLNK